MKIARYLAHGQISYGAVEGDSVKELSASPFEDFTVTDHTHKLSEVKLLAPCEPTKVLAIGLNYSSHLHDRPRPHRAHGLLQDPNLGHRPRRNHHPAQGHREAGRRS